MAGDDTLYTFRIQVNELRRVESSQSGCTIFRIPANVCRRREHLFHPEMVSIGPYHHGKSEFAPMERVKGELQNELLRNDTQVKSCLSKLKALEDKARRCYFHSINLSSEDFLLMLLKDCCFIIQFLFIIKTRNSGNTVCGTKWIQSMIIHDLLLLENQIPFFVLQTLYEHLDHTNSSLPTIRPNIFALIQELFLSTKQHTTTPDSRMNYHHLVDLFHQCIRPPAQPTQITHLSLVNKLIRLLNPLKLISAIFSYIFITVWKLFRHHQHYAPRSIPSATSLHAAGVSFRKKSLMAPDSIFEPSFNSVQGILEIPQIMLCDEINCLLANLVAFEQYTGNREQVVSSYAIFMDNLVDTPEDVELLVRSGIIEKMMPSNDEVARFFNQLTNSCRLNNYDEHMLVKLFMDINDYSRIFWHAWRAKLMRDYFSNPWSVISIVAALLLLILTLIQTIFSVLAYYK